MQIIPKRKNCMEVSGGRLTYQADYEMPGLAMQISSRQSDHCMHGGGEVHYISSCASGRITRLMLADICGSEDIFKRLSCEMRNGLLRNINSIWQDRVVADMSQQFREFARLGGFATASVATFFAPTRSFAMCNIGNPPPLVYRAGEKSWEVLHGETQYTDEPCESPEGVFLPEEYRHIKTKLELDDIVVLYGNGFAQSTFPDGNPVGHNKLLEALQDAPHSHPKSRLAHLVRLILDNNEPQEDSTVVVCQVTNTGVRLRDNLLRAVSSVQTPQRQDPTHLKRHTPLESDSFAMRHSLLLFVPLTLICCLDAMADSNDNGRILFDFSDSDAGQQWQIVNDGVMGGRSTSQVAIDDENHMRFSGVLSLENNGGFASVRSKPADLKLGTGGEIVLRVKGDGRRYTFNLYVAERRMAFSHQLDFQTKANEWVEVKLPINRFVATSFGRPVPGATLNLSSVNSVGILLGDKKPGPFEILVDSIKVQPPAS